MPTASSINRLSRATEVDEDQDEPPVPAHFDFPERILQFGTGAFLRGFSDVFVDEANREGLFAGRIVMVGSTGSGRAEAINEQDGLYTVCIQGVEDGEIVHRCRIVGSVSRAVASPKNWSEVVEFATSPDLQFVISNTTEVGIRYDADDRPDLDPPRSFPGKLAALLHARAEALNYDSEGGLIILCCELIERNGSKLREIVLQLAGDWELGDDFARWVKSSCRFCNTLVDRIVPGTPDPARREELESRLGYRDPLVVQAEPYGLWAIEGGEALRRAIPFSEADPAIVITDDIGPFRERKVRILNGAHSSLVPLSFLCGNDTVSESMKDPQISMFVRRIMLEEIVPSMDRGGKEESRFARQVIDRFANPFMHHELLSIALHQTSKMNVRVVPSIVGFTEKRGELPRGLLLGFAAFLVFALRKGRAAEAELPEDSRAERIQSHWTAGEDTAEFVRAVAADESLWSHRLDELPGFVDTVARHVNAIQRDGAVHALESFLYATNGQD